MSNLSKLQTEFTQSYKKAKNENTKAVNEYLATLKESYKKKLEAYKEETAKKKAAVPRNYTDDYDLNAINKLINERKLKERMASLGLTNSGVNQTLSTGLDIAKQNADNIVTFQKNEELSNLDNALNQYYKSLASDFSSKKDAAKKSLNDKNASLVSNLTAKYNQAVKEELDKKEKEEKEKAKAKEKEEKEKAKAKEKEEKEKAKAKEKANSSKKTATNSELISVYNKLISMNSPKQQMFYIDVLYDDGVFSSTQVKRLKERLGLSNYY